MPLRPDHGLDLALPGLRSLPRVDPEPAERADQRALRALAEENALLARELGRVQARCTQWRDDCIAQAERLEALLMRSRAERIVKETQLAALRDTLAELHQRAAVWLSHEELVRRIADLRARHRTLETALAERHGALAPAVGPALCARRVLCVGGRARQVPIYRELVERGGGTFTHVDGAGVDRLPDLQRSLAGADLVILQPGYVCQGACRVVEAHCHRTGVQLVQLDKACVIGFARMLEQAFAAA